MTKRFIAFIFITIISLQLTVGAKVGVVMSGGGAKGLYHIGVLDALEQSGVPIDYVAGTSMGAIIAALYAAGYSPDDMRAIALSGELDSWISGKIDENYGAYFRQVRQYRQEPPFLSVRIDPEKDDERLHMPRSLIPTTQIDMALTELFSPATVASGGDFDKLMVPFLCVASDVVNRRAKILTEGDLGFAVRASMAIPIAFSPVMDGDKLLYDGGIYDNFPWRYMQERFSPELMIGSVCGDDSATTSRFSSLVDQAFLLTMNNTDYTLPEGNFLVKRNVPRGMLDFDNAQEAIDMGYEDTMAQIDSILLKVDHRRDSSYYAQRRELFLARAPEMRIEEYDIEGLDRDQHDYVYDYMRTSFKDRESRRGKIEDGVGFEDLKSNLFGVLSTGDFVSNYPEMTYNPESERFRFSVELETKPSLKFSLGGNLSSTPFNQIYLGATYHKIGRVAQSAYLELYLGPLYNSGVLGGRIDFYMNKPLFVDYYYSFDVANLNHGNFGNLTSVDNVVSLKRNDQHLSLGVGLPTSRRSMASFRANMGSDNYLYSDDDNIMAASTAAYIERTRFQFVAAKFGFERNTLNDMLYPSRGSQFNLSAIGVAGIEQSYYADDAPDTSTPLADDLEHSWLGARLEYTKIFEMRGAEWFSLGLNLDCVYTNFDVFGNLTSSLVLMPSYSPVQHSKMIYMPEYSAQSFAAMGLMPRFNIMDNFSLQTGFYAMLRHVDVTDEIAELSPDIRGHSMRYISQAAFVYQTPIGPASLALTKYNIEDWNNLYLTFNFGYAIFAPRGTFY